MMASSDATDDLDYCEYLEPGCSPYEGDQLEDGRQGEFEKYEKPGKDLDDDSHGSLLDHEEGQHENIKYKIRKEYGVEFEIPAMYILDSKFYPGNTLDKYMIRIVKYSKPKKSQKKYVVHSQSRGGQ
jgi:hypothetical protein